MPVSCQVGGHDVGRSVDLVDGPVDVSVADHIGLVTNRVKRQYSWPRTWCCCCAVRARPTVCVARDGRRGSQEVLALMAARDVLRSRLVQPLKVSTLA